MKIEWKSCLKVAVSAFLLYLGVTYWPYAEGGVRTLAGAAMPLILGGVVAYVINILMSFYEKHYFPRSRNAKVVKSRRAVCMLGAFLTLVVIVALLAVLVVPELAASVEMLIAKAPGAAEDLVAWLKNTGIMSEERLAELSSVDWSARVEQMTDVLTKGVSDVMGKAISAVSSVFSGVVTGVLAVIFSIYVLTGKEKLGNQFDRLMKRYLKGKTCQRIEYVLRVLDDCFHKYIVGQCVEAVILGALCAVGMMLLRIPYATMTGAVIAFTALIPVAGAYIGAAVGAFLILTVSPVKALIFLIFLVVLQQLEGNLIYPRVVGSSMGLPAIWVLAAVTVGGGVMGITGMLLGVPIMAAIYRLVKEDVDRPSES